MSFDECLDLPIHMIMWKIQSLVYNSLGRTDLKAHKSPDTQALFGIYKRAGYSIYVSHMQKTWFL